MTSDPDEQALRDKASGHQRGANRAPQESRNAPVWSEPAPDAQWEVWYWDTFDREAPPRVDTKGRGLARGLAELWARYLGETIRPGGSQGFSRFSFKWDQGAASIRGNRQGATRLRGWVFGDKERFSKGYVGESDTPFLKIVATAHAHLLLEGQSSEPILEAAAVSTDRKEFEARLAIVVHGIGGH